MANSNVKFGLKPINAMGGTNPGSTNMYFIASDASAIFQGSPVQAELSGGTIQVLGNATGDTKQILGVFAGCEYVDNTTKKTKIFQYILLLGQQTLTMTSKVYLR